MQYFISIKLVVSGAISQVTLLLGSLFIATFEDFVKKNSFYLEVFCTADEITSELMGAILEDLKPEANEEVLLHVNGFGATPSMELYLLLGLHEFYEKYLVVIQMLSKEELYLG